MAACPSDVKYEEIMVELAAFMWWWWLQVTVTAAATATVTMKRGWWNGLLRALACPIRPSHSAGKRHGYLVSVRRNDIMAARRAPNRQAPPFPSNMDAIAQPRYTPSLARSTPPAPSLRNLSFSFSFILVPSCFRFGFSMQHPHTASPTPALAQDFHQIAGPSPTLNPV